METTYPASTSQNGTSFYQRSKRPLSTLFMLFIGGPLIGLAAFVVFALGFTPTQMATNLLRELSSIQQMGTASSADHVMLRHCVAQGTEKFCSDVQLVEASIDEEAKRIAGNIQKWYLIFVGLAAVFMLPEFFWKRFQNRRRSRHAVKLSS